MTIDIMQAIRDKYPDAQANEIRAALTPEFLKAAYGELPSYSTLDTPALHIVKTATVGSFVIPYGKSTKATAKGDYLIGIIERSETGPNGEKRYGVTGGYTDLGGTNSVGEQPKPGAVRELKEELLDHNGNSVISPDPSRLVRLSMDDTIDYRNPNLPVQFNPHSLELNAREVAALTEHAHKLEGDANYRESVRQQSGGEITGFRMMPAKEVLAMPRESFTHPHEYDAVINLVQQLQQQEPKLER